MFTSGPAYFGIVAVFLFILVYLSSKIFPKMVAADSSYSDCDDIDGQKYGMVQ